MHRPQLDWVREERNTEREKEKEISRANERLLSPQHCAVHTHTSLLSIALTQSYRHRNDSQDRSGPDYYTRNNYSMNPFQLVGSERSVLWRKRKREISRANEGSLGGATQAHQCWETRQRRTIRLSAPADTCGLAGGQPSSGGGG
jgi:hypothetical protein